MLFMYGFIKVDFDTKLKNFDRNMLCNIYSYLHVPDFNLTRFNRFSNTKILVLSIWQPAEGLKIRVDARSHNK